MKACTSSDVTSTFAGLWASLTVTLTVRCQGNALEVEYSGARLDIRGNEDELLLWSLGKFSQDSQGIGPRRIAFCRYPNFLGVNDSFSPFKAVFCFAEALDEELKLTNASEQIGKVLTFAETTRGQLTAKMEEVRGKGASEAEIKAMKAKLDDFEKFMEEQKRKANELEVEQLKTAYKAFVYEVDVASLINGLKNHSEAARKALADRITATTVAEEDLGMPPAPDANDEKEKAVKHRTEMYMWLKWRMADLVRLGFAKKLEEKPHEPGGIYVRYEHQGKPVMAYRKIPHLDIYKPWKVLMNSRDVWLDSRGQISPEKFDNLLEEFYAKQKSLRATLAYGVSKIPASSLQMMQRTPALRDAKILPTETVFTVDAPSDKFHVHTGSLVRQEDACKDLSAEVVQRTGESEKDKEEKAKKEGSEGKAQGALE